MHHIEPSPSQALLNQAIAAARQGRKTQAQAALFRVLAETPYNTKAMCWLAFVAPTPQESVDWLEKALKLEPDNAQLKAGLTWANERQAAAVAAHAPRLFTELTRRLDDDLGHEQSDLEPTDEPVPVSPPVKQRRFNLTRMVSIGLIVGCIAFLLGSGGIAVLSPPATILANWFPSTPSLIDDAPPPSAPLTLTEAKILPIPQPDLSGLVDASVTRNDDLSLVDALSNDASLESEPDIDSVGSDVSPNLEATSIVMERQLVAQDESAKAALAETNAVSIDGPQNSGLADDDPADSDLEPASVAVPADQALDGVRLHLPVDPALLVHQPASSTEKWIEVNLTAQRVTAWEGNVPVMSFIGSTGLPQTPTVQGKFNIYWKLKSTPMSGPGYYLPDVPHAMFFYAGYALHGAYWHNNFGQPMSHGCVNLGLDDSEQLFDWAGPALPEGQNQVTASAANPGTLVVVHAAN